MQVKIFSNFRVATIAGEGRVIQPDGKVKSPGRQYEAPSRSFGVEGNIMVYNDVQPDADLVIDWVFTNFAGHMFRVVSRPNELTEAQRETAREFLRDVTQLYDSALASLTYGDLARVTGGWSLDYLPQTAPKGLCVFEDFRVAMGRFETDDREEIQAIEGYAKLIPDLTELGRRLEFDPDRKLVRQAGGSSREQLYRLNYGDLYRMRDAVKIALKRQKKRLGGGLN